jgi:membrane protein EpsK
MREVLSVRKRALNHKLPSGNFDLMPAAVVTSPPVAAPASGRSRHIVNLGANLGQLGLSLIVGVWYVPFLVRHLGPAVYGLIPLATSLTAYMALITLALNSAVGRYLTIALEQEDHQRANRIFNTSFWGSIALTAVLLVLAVLGVIYLDRLIKIPAGFDAEARWLFVGTAAAFLLNEIKTPFDVSSFSRNRFDLRNLVAISELLTRVGLIVLLFYVVRPRVSFVGLGILSGTVVSTLGAIWLWKVLTPSLRVRARDFDREVLRDLANTGGWVVINQIGAILYLNIDVLVANRLFGPEQSGKYAAMLQLPYLIRLLGTTVAGVFSPTILYYFARNDPDGLMLFLRRTIKCMGFMLALPIGLMCGFSEPLLRLWLGPGFSEFSPLLFLMAAHLCINVAVLPLLGLQLAANRVKTPALVTIVMGLANLGLALVLAGPTGWGLYGIAAAGAIMLTAKNVFFTPAYAAHIMDKPLLSFWRELGLIVAVTAGTVLLCRLALWFGPVNGWIQMGGVASIISIFYLLAAYRFFLNSEERVMVRSMLPGGKK